MLGLRCLGRGQKEKNLDTSFLIALSLFCDTLPLRESTLLADTIRTWWMQSAVVVSFHVNGTYPATSFTLVDIGTMRARCDPMTWRIRAGRVKDMPLPSISLPTLTPNETQRISPLRIFTLRSSWCTLFLTSFHLSKSLKYTEILTFTALLRKPLTPYGDGIYEYSRSRKIIKAPNLTKAFWGVIPMLGLRCLGRSNKRISNVFALLKFFG